MDLSRIQVEQQQRDVDGGLRKAGSDNHNHPRPYSAYGCVPHAHARRMDGRAVTLRSVYVVCCLLSTWYKSELCVHESP